MVQVSKSIVMVTNMKVCLSRVKDVGRGRITLRKDKFIRDSGIMERFKALGSANGLTVSSIKGIGLIIRKMGKGFTSGLMEDNIRATTEMIRNMVLAPMCGWMVESIWASGKTTKDMVKVNMLSVINRLKREFGSKILELSGSMIEYI